MGVRFPSAAVVGSTPVLPANANETIIATLPPLNVSLDFSQIFLYWTVVMGTGATTTFLNFRLRRGTTLAGALVGLGVFSFAVAAANTYTVSGCYADTPGAVAGQQYVLTVVQQAATGAGNVNDSALIAFAL